MKRFIILMAICLTSLGLMAQYNRPTQTPPPPAQGQYDQHHDHNHDTHHGNQPGHHNPNQPGHHNPNQPGHNPGHHQPTPPPPAPAPVYMANAEQLQRALQVIEKQSYDDKRMEIAKLCVVLCPFPVRDLAKMANCFTMEDRKVDFLIFAHAYCPDKENYYMLRDVLRYRSDYDKLMERTQPGYRRP